MSYVEYTGKARAALMLAEKCAKTKITMNIKCEFLASDHAYYYSFENDYLII